MYHQNYKDLINNEIIEKGKEIDKIISEEKKKENIDRHKILRLKEQKIMQGMFVSQIGSAINKYRQPW